MMRYEPVTVVIRYANDPAIDTVRGYLVMDPSSTQLAAAYVMDGEMRIAKVERLPGEEGFVYEIIGASVSVSENVADDSAMIALCNELCATSAFAFIRDIVIDHSAVAEMGLYRR